MEQVAWFTPNETEAAFYVGDGHDTEDSARKLLDKGLRGVVLKRGGDGAYVAVRGQGEVGEAVQSERDRYRGGRRLL